MEIKVKRGAHDIHPLKLDFLVQLLGFIFVSVNDTVFDLSYDYYINYFVRSISSFSQHSICDTISVLLFLLLLLKCLMT